MFLEFDSYYIGPIQEKDAWRLCDFISANEDRLKRFFSGTLAQNLSPELSAVFTKKKVAQLASKEEFVFILKEKKHHTIIGMVYLKELDWDKKQGELAYCIAYQYEGKGYISQTVAAISDWALQELQLNTLQIIAHKSNISSVAVAKKCNYLWQKVLPNAHTPPGENALDMELYELKS